MTPAEVAAKLQHFNDWRRGGDIDQPDPLAVGEAIDAAIEMIDRLEAAEKAVTEAYQRGYATGQEEIAAELEFAKREVANLHDDIHELTDERDALRAKIEQMEKQEPVAWTTKLALEYGASRLGFQVSGVNIWSENGVPLYALPGAQPAPSVPEFCPCCGNIMRACMYCPNEDCNAVTATAEQSKYNKQHALARKASGAAAPEAKP